MNLTHRPPLGLRVFVALIGIGIVLANAAVLLSDRAPGVLQTLFGDLARKITERLDAEGRAETALEANDVGTDSVVHFGLWFVAALIVGMALWSWIGLACSALVVAVTSLGLEVAQGRYSTTRAVEASDAAFNLLGVAAGSIVVAILYVAGEAIGRLFAPRS